MRVGNVKEIVFSKDPKQMNWLREDFPYAEVKCPPEFSAEVQNEKDGDVLTTKIVVSYNGAHPYFTNAGSIGVSFPLQDRYTDSVTCRDYRCHLVCRHFRRHFVQFRRLYYRRRHHHLRESMMNL